MAASGAPVLVAAADAGEGDDRADIGAAARELRRLGRGVERLALQTDGGGHGATPRLPREASPVIGGKKAISRAPAIAVSALT